MEIRFSYDHKFDNLINKIKLKYGENILRFSGVHPEQLDIADFTREFLFGDPAVAVADRSVDSNANVDDRSVVAFDHELAKAQNKLNALNMIWTHIIRIMTERGEAKAALKVANEAIESIINCSLYVNDSHFAHKSYCYSFDLTPLVFEGMPFVKKIKIGPPKHYTSMINLIVQSTAFISNQIAGAASYPNAFVYLDYFARRDYGELYWEGPFRDQIEQGFQNLVYSLNFPFRGNQSAFVTLSIYDRPFLETLFENITYPDGSKADLDSIDYLQKWYFRWFNEESKKQVFTFPVTTANLACEDNVIFDEGFLDYVAETDLEMGLLNIYSGPPNALSNCCRLRSKLIKEHTNSLGTGSVSIGSHRVCTINLPRIAIEADGDANKFMDILRTRLYLTISVLNAHRSIIQDLIKRGRLPLYTHGWMHLNKQYSTVGLIGPYEACKFMGMNITNDEGADFIVRIMDFINEVCLDEEATWKDGRRFNLELIPGEQAAIKMCEADKMIYPSFPNQYKLYSNQFIPLIDKCDISERIRMQGIFDSRAQGGCIMHLNLDHQLTHKEQVKNLIRASVKAGAMYYAINYNIAMCENNHQSIGKYKTCPICSGKITSNKTRVVGFITDESEWHKVRRWEGSKRVFYDEESIDDSPMAIIPEPEFVSYAVS